MTIPPVDSAAAIATSRIFMFLLFLLATPGSVPQGFFLRASLEHYSGPVRLTDRVKRPYQQVA